MKTSRLLIAIGVATLAIVVGLFVVTLQNVRDAAQARQDSVRTLVERLENIQEKQERADRFHRINNREMLNRILRCIKTGDCDLDEARRPPPPTATSSQQTPPEGTENAPDERDRSRPDPQPRPSPKPEPNPSPSPEECVEVGPLKVCP